MLNLAYIFYMVQPFELDLNPLPIEREYDIVFSPSLFLIFAFPCLTTLLELYSYFHPFLALDLILISH